jgi:hypothetical protein
VGEREILSPVRKIPPVAFFGLTSPGLLKTRSDYDLFLGRTKNYTRGIILRRSLAGIMHFEAQKKAHLIPTGTATARKNLAGDGN